MEDIKIQIPAELFDPAEHAHFDGTIHIDTLKVGPDDYTFAAPLSWQIDVMNTGEALLVAGEVSGMATTSCARCLEDMTFPVTGKIEGYYLIAPDAAAPEDMDDDEFEVLSADKRISLTPLITAALMLEMPLQPLCSDECKGICPTCGQDLNKGTCSCAERDGVDSLNPFSVLRDYTFEDAQN